MKGEEEGEVSFGERLRRRREEKDVTLEQISKATKISIHLLHAMEHDDWDSLPGGIFTRNFLRLYAGHTGLDEERIVEEFRQYLKSKRKENDVEEEDGEAKVGAKLEVPKGWLYALFAVVVLLLIGGYLGISYLIPLEREAPRAEDRNRAVGAFTSPENETTGTGKQGLRIELEETRENSCWYKYYADGEGKAVEESRILRGQTVVLEADEKIELHIAHIDSIAVKVNGKPIRDWGVFPQRQWYDSANNVTFIIEITADAVFN